mgnify:CR=1 FL=1
MVSGHGPYLTDADGLEYVDLRRVVGTDDPRARPPCGRRGRAGGSRARAVVRHADPGRGGAGGRIDQSGEPGRAGALGQLGNRGHDERHPARARRHRAKPSREVRRVLPRPRRCAARRGWIRRCDLRPAGYPGCHRRPDGRRRSCCRTTTWAPSRRHSTEHGTDIACVITEAAAGNMGAVPPSTGFNAGLREITARARCAAHHGRGDDRIPGRAQPAGTDSIRSMPTCSPSAR